jgi:IclR family transcriptional regulator, pca regulon regulatory protein
MTLPSTTIQARDYLQVLARGLSIMECFAGQNEYLTVAELAKIADLPRATVRRCLLTLRALGYVEVMNEKLFRLAPKVLVLARAYTSSSLLPRIAQPILERLSETLRESCTVWILSGDEAIFVARSTRKRKQSRLRDVGSDVPAYVTSMGRCLLAALSERDLDAYLERADLRRYTAHSVVDPKKLRSIIKKVREQEFCVVDQEFDLGLRSVAVPIRSSSGRIVAALSATADAGRTTERELVARFLPELRAAAAEIRSYLPG